MNEEAVVTLEGDVVLMDPSSFPPWYPVSFEKEGEGYLVAINPGVLVDLLEGKVYRPSMTNPISISSGDFLVATYKVKNTGEIEEGTFAVTSEEGEPSKPDPERPPIADNEGGDGEYKISLGKFVFTEDGDKVTLEVEDAVRSDLVHRPIAPRMENKGGGGQIAKKFDKEEHYQLRSIAKAPGDSGDKLGDLVEGRVEVNQTEDAIELRGTGKNLNLRIRLIELLDGPPPQLQWVDSGEAEVTLYWRDGLFVGDEDPDDIGECHELIEQEVASLVIRTKAAPCPPPEEEGEGEGGEP